MIDLVDEAGSEISGTVFVSTSWPVTDASKDPRSVLVVGNTYKLSNGMVREAYYPTPEEAYELTFGEFASYQ